jgi:UDP-N-acetylmuramoyl-tripeptide--D-alanyl-D-alanine ligase
VREVLAEVLVNAPAEDSPAFYASACLDSRGIAPGDLFVCLKGERVDGHDFLDEAARAGAAGAVVQSGRSPAVPPGVAAYEVRDTLAALRLLGAAWRARHSIPVVAVGGSVGKTTTKELLAAALEAIHPGAVLKTAGSENGFIGIPKTLLGLRRHHRVAVVEIGIDAIGAMASHVETVAPTHAALTAIGAEHLERLRDLATVAREERDLLERTLGRGGTVLVNLDDPQIAPLCHPEDAAAYAFTLGQGLAAASARVLAGAVEEGASALQPRLRVAGLGQSEASLTLPLPGLHNARNALAALALAALLGVPIAAGSRALEGARPAFGRSEVSRLADDTLVLRDYYNASPISVRAALELLGATASRGDLWACLGDMLELGEGEESLHRELAGPIAAAGARHVLLLGPRMGWLADELARRAFPGEIQRFESRAAMAEALARGVEPCARVLIKGSRGMRMEEVWRDFAELRERRDTP